MSLTLVAVPIGHDDDLTLRAINTLRTAEVVIGEEKKPLHRLFAALKLPQPSHIELLNEHSAETEIKALVEICKHQRVALITDCGTPGFCDPGARLVELCRADGVAVTSNPGPCSLAAFLSLTGRRLDQFYFQGFLPRDKGERIKRLQFLDKHLRPFILMDTPYRLERTISECHLVCNNRQAVVGLNLTKEDEKFYAGSLAKIMTAISGQKQEFLLLIE